MRVAVLDLGTNTFNLIVAESKEVGAFRILYNNILPVKLGEGGIINQQIAPEAFERGMTAIEKHFLTIRSFKAEKIYAFGTSALRTARNSQDFINTIKNTTGIDVEIITGDREAELIYYGVRQTYNMQSGKYMILDIGGGSNEFIIANNQKIFWKRSYPLGVARLLESFKPSDPITSKEIITIEKYLKNELSDMIRLVKKENIKILLGASGSFDTFVAMIHSFKNNFETGLAIKPKSVHISNNDFEKLYRKLIRSTHDERSTMRGLESIRNDVIVLACLFVKFITKTLGIETIIQSNFSLREGVVYQLFKN
jgi:exopolyphosphatase/guanosine-5'-triphosphate,3'-diphosphate pyrophosphatase